MNVGRHIAANLDELREIQSALDEGQLQAVANACLSANRIFFSGMGRSGNMVKALAIRFMHLGYAAYVAGDAATPSNTGKRCSVCGVIERKNQGYTESYGSGKKAEGTCGSDILSL